MYNYVDPFKINTALQIKIHYVYNKVRVKVERKTRLKISIHINCLMEDMKYWRRQRLKKKENRENNKFGMLH